MLHSFNLNLSKPSTLSGRVRTSASTSVLQQRRKSKGQGWEATSNEVGKGCAEAGAAQTTNRAPCWVRIPGLTGHGKDDVFFSQTEKASLSNPPWEPIWANAAPSVRNTPPWETFDVGVKQFSVVLIAL